MSGRDSTDTPIRLAAEHLLFIVRGCGTTNKYIRNLNELKQGEPTRDGLNGISVHVCRLPI